MNKRERKNKSALQRMSERWEQRKKAKGGRAEDEKAADGNAVFKQIQIQAQQWQQLHRIWLDGMYGLGSPPKRPAAPPCPEIRHTTTPLIGYRAWQVVKTDVGWRLRSVTTHSVWDGPILRSDKKPWHADPHKAYAFDLGDEGMAAVGHGIYAWKNPGHTLEAGYNMHAAGRIALSGRVVVHKNGFRAETATVQRLVLLPIAPFKEYTALTFRIALGTMTSESAPIARFPKAMDWRAVVADLSACYDCPVSTDWTTLMEDDNGSR